MSDEAVVKILLQDDTQDILNSPAAAPPKEKERIEKSIPKSASKEEAPEKGLWNKLQEGIIQGAANVIHSNLSQILGTGFSSTLVSHVLDQILSPGISAAKQPDDEPEVTASSTATGTNQPKSHTPSPATNTTQTPTTPTASSAASGPNPVTSASSTAATAATTAAQTTASSAVPAATAAAAPAATTAATGATTATTMGAGAVAGAAAGSAAGPAGMVVGAAAAIILGDKILQTVVQLAGYLQRTMDQMLMNSKNFSPEVAQQAAASELRQISMELRRAREIGPALARYEKFLSVTSTGIEELKTKIVQIADFMVNDPAGRVGAAVATVGMSEVVRRLYTLLENYVADLSRNQMEQALDFFDKPLQQNEAPLPAAPVMPVGIF